MPSYDYDALVSEISDARKLAREAEEAMVEATAQDQTSLKQTLIEHLAMSVDKFETLSGHCPMTPLLWMQYALDASEVISLVSSSDEPTNDMAIQTRLQLLELGLHEFPGSAILRLQYVELMFVSILLSVQQQQDGQSTDVSTTSKSLDQIVAEYKEALDKAVAIVGDGSHRNEARMVVQFFQLQCHIEQWSFKNCKKNIDDIQQQQLVRDRISQIYWKRAKVPMNDEVNSGLAGEYATTCRTTFQSTPDASVLARIEENRRWESKHYGFLGTFEDDIDVALQTELGVSNRTGIDRALRENEEGFEKDPVQILQKWKRLLNDPSISTLGCWMGMGGPQTAQAYFQYAQACFRFRNRTNHSDDDTKANNKDLGTKIQDMALSVFERGVAECPTVDTLWLSYLRRLRYLLERTEGELRIAAKTDADILRQRQIKLLNDAATVVDRAIRNCPYSTELVKVKLKILLGRVNAGMMVLDPEDLLIKLIIQQALGNGFIEAALGENIHPTAAVELFRALSDVVRKRILFLLAEAAQTKCTAANTATTGKHKKAVTVVMQYDEPESIEEVLLRAKTRIPTEDETSGTLNESLLQDLEDLSIDLREIYEEADSYLRKHNKKYTNKTSLEECRAILANDRALTESYLVAPLLLSIQKRQTREKSDDKNENDRAETHVNLIKEQEAEILRQHDKAAKIWQPPHPSIYVSFLRTLSAMTSVGSALLFSPLDIVRNLRRMRFLYQKALKSVGKPKEHVKDSETVDEAIPLTTLSQDELDYDTALRCLCRDYLFFERNFGSDRSYAECSKAIQKKLAKAFAIANDTDVGAATLSVVNADSVSTAIPMDTEHNDKANAQKRKREDDGDGDNVGGTMDDETGEGECSPPGKKQKAEDAPTDSSKRPTTFKEVEEEKGVIIHKKYTVKVGKLEYPAHPFTVKVSFLSPDTEDMDLVDILRPKCGAIVHAKIIREKHHHGKKGGSVGMSKGWALVQFEERDAAETALSLSDVIGIQGKSVKIERSHLPAVGLVPSGMHRVNPKGEGKSTKRNLLRKNEKRNDNTKPPPSSPAPSQTPAAKSDGNPSPSSTTNIFAFRPRGVTFQKRKAKVALAGTFEPKNTTDERNHGD